MAAMSITEKTKPQSHFRHFVKCGFLFLSFNFVMISSSSARIDGEETKKKVINFYGVAKEEKTISLKFNESLKKKYIDHEKKSSNILIKQSKDVLSIKSQIDEADAIVVGHFLSQKMTSKNPDVRQLSLKLNQEFGLNPALSSFGEILIHLDFSYPLTDEEKLFINKGHTFIPGENLVFFLRHQDGRFWPLHGAFSSFKLINYGGKKILVNSVFQDKTFVAQMEKDHFDQYIREAKNVGLTQVYDILLQEEFAAQKVQRSPASISYDSYEIKNQDSSKSLQMAESIQMEWILLTLALILIFQKSLSRRQKKF